MPLRQYQFDKFSVQADLIANEEEFQALLEMKTESGVVPAGTEPGNGGNPSV